MLEKLRPLHDKILVKRLEDQQQTDSGLYIPDSAKDNKALQVRVIAIGTGKPLPDGTTHPLQVTPGDLLMIGKYAGTDAGHDYLVIREEDILGILG
ncbi:MAG TPA: co-chaperone GroES [Candidatus Babeliales bacterium]|nr:co-chaperone GroES [Candidatus Babeliales bacterium]